MRTITEQRKRVLLPMASMKRLMASVVGVLMLSAALMAGAASAGTLQFTSLSAGGFNADGSPATQAGGHPYELKTAFTFNTVFDTRINDDVPTAALRNSTFDLPAGVLGNPTATPQCTQENFNVLLGHCPPTTQIGLATIDVAFNGGRTIRKTPIYNLAPPPGMPAQFGFLVVAAAAHIDLTVRSDGDYGVQATVRNANTAAPVYAVTLEIWGVPADTSHDGERYLFAENPGDENGNPFSVRTPRRPLLRNPTSCTGAPVITRAVIDNWQDGSASNGSAEAPPVTGCEHVPFSPTIDVQPDSRSAGSSAGLGVDINLPQNDNPDGVATSDLKQAVVKLPAGVAINPSSADGLASCSDAQFGLHSKSVDACPIASKIGSATVTSPLLDDPLKGDVFLATPLEQGPLAAAAGRMYRLWITGEGSGVRLKLAGSVVPDPVTGQLTTTFDNNPQLPFSNLHVQFAGGDRAPLTAPKQCGTYTSSAELSPWSAPESPVSTSSTFTIDQNCDRGAKFEPTFSAGLTDPIAGGSSAFTLNVGRPDGQQDIVGLTTVLPAGLLAHVGAVPRCGNADAAAGTCPAASLVGHTTVASGSGSSPVWIPQAGKAPTGVYLAGPYTGALGPAPYSLSIVVPAQAGPFDLGRVVVRAALYVDPVDAHVTVVSDPLPTILDGVPLNIQKINVTVDRAGFMANPTDCSRKTIYSKVTSAHSAVEGLTPFQVGGCASLKVDPKLTLDLSGKGQTKDGAHPQLDAHLTMPQTGQANLKNVKVTLPLALALDPDNSQGDDLCEFEVGRQTIPACPARSIVGNATATTPLLDVPLTGPVYFVKNVRKDPKTGRSIRTLPTLAIPLRGGGITLVLRAQSEVKDEHLVTTFSNVPDAPVSDFKLRINGGKKDILVVSGTDICKGNQVTKQVSTGHNGRVAKDNITMGTPCALGVAGSSHTSSALKLTVSGLGAGKVTVSGNGLVKTSRTLAKSNVATLQPKFSKSVKSQLAHGHNVKIRVAIAFKAKGSKKTKTVRKTLTVHGAKR
jgi:hypothetical protein